MSRILDERVDGLASDNGLYDLHEELELMENQVSAALDSDDMDGLKGSFPAFVKFNEEHLQHEEDIMMPNVQKMAKAGEPMKKYMVEEILPTVLDDDFEFFVKYANQMLEKYDGGMPRARVFDHALWAAATPDQWKVWTKWIEESLSDKAIYAEIQGLTE